MKYIALKSVVNSSLNIGIRFLYLVFIYALLRLGFYAFNRDLFPGISGFELAYMMWGGLKFDLVALLYLNILYIFLWSIPFPFKYVPGYQVFAKGLFIGTNSLGVLLNLVDYAYYPFTLKRTTGTVFSQFSQEENLGKLGIDFLFDYWYLGVLFCGFVYAFIRLYDCIQVRKPSRIDFQFYVFQSVLFLVTIFLFIGGVRGGWAHSTRPITLSNAGDYVKKPEEISIVINTPFSILKTLNAVRYERLHFYKPEELAQLYTPIHLPKETQAPFQKLNVVFLIMESFGKENIGALNRDIDGGKYAGYTPFLDSLIAESYTFSKSYANGRKSIDALPSVITGIPSVGEPFVLSIYSNNQTTSIAKLLGNEGYQTAFFHGAPNGSMGFSAYMNLAGVQHYYGKNEYNNDADYDGIWGIWDEPFMQYMAQTINTFKTPFFASFFSLSSHHPFKVPAKYAGLFPKGNLPVQEPIGYSDHALREFFATAAKMPWYKNTLFVICADHATTSYLPEYTNLAGSFSIPILFYYPGGQLKGYADKLVQQIDIMPTVLNFLHYDKPYFSFGFDAFNNEVDNFVVNNNGGFYNLFYQDYMLTHDGQKPVSLYNIQKDRLMKEDLLHQDLAIMPVLISKLQAFMQQYNNRMIQNDLIYKP